MANVEIVAEPLHGMFADPVAIRIVGLAPSTQVVLEATTARLGAGYRAWAAFRALDGAAPCREPPPLPHAATAHSSDLEGATP